MTKPALLLLALYGLGDDHFQVRQASERYLAASGHDAVLLNRLAPYLSRDLQTRATLRKLERRYYAGWDAKLARNDWREYPSLVVLSPWCHPQYQASGRFAGRFAFWDVGGAYDPFRPLVVRYYRRAHAEWKHASRLVGEPVPTMPLHQHGGSNGATLELCKDLRSWGAPAWAQKALLGTLRWRNASLERRYGVGDPNFSRR